MAVKPSKYQISTGSHHKAEQATCSERPAADGEE
jgi:hypothetical protein